MRRWLIAVLVIGLAACSTVRKVESGSNMVGARMQVTIEGSWNHLDFPNIAPAKIWTMEGVTVDELLLYSGIRDGQAMHPANDASGSKKAAVVFRKGMSSEELVSMFEAVLSRDESIFKLTKVEPAMFGERKGVRFEYERIRKYDNLRQQGIGYATIADAELFAMVYQAPRLTFFPKYRGLVEGIANSVVIKSSVVRS